MKSFPKKNSKTYGLTALAEIVIIIPQIISGVYFHINLKDFNNIVTVLGIIIYLFGLSFAIWAKLTMKKNWGIPAQHDINRQKDLVINGPYKYSRNPIYVGLVAIALGFSLTLRSYFIFLIPILYFYFNNAIKTEENLLDKHFGEKYKRYKQKVPRFLF